MELDEKTILSLILKRIESLEKEIEELKAKKKEESKSPQFYSLSAIESRMVEEERKKREQLEPILDRATDLTIEYFKRFPPKRKVT